MNIFVVEKNPIDAARQLPDKLICKMPVETAQMLCTAHRLLSTEKYCTEKKLYKKAFWNHPCTIWARETHCNYLWLLKHWVALCDEFQQRYGKQHKSYTDLHAGLSELPSMIPVGNLTNFAQAMPIQYKNLNNPVQAYRKYMIAEKHYAQWNKGSKKPYWWKL